MAQTPATPATGSDIQAQWARVRGRLRAEYGEAAFRSWLKSMTLAEVAEGRVRIGVPTRFLRDWVAAHYGDRIRALWNGENTAISTIDIFVSGVPAAAAEPAVHPITGVKVRDVGEAAARDGAAPPEAAEDKEVGAALDPRFTF